MKNRMAVFVALALGLAGAGAALGKPRTYQLPEPTATFRAGPGVEAAQGNCMSCHSADYVAYQPPGKGAAFWDAEVQKMIKVYHAPIAEADAKAIAEYLAKTY